MRRPSHFRLLSALFGAGLAASACAGPSVLVVGENVRPPEPPPPVVTVNVLAADDGTTPGGVEVRFDGEVAVADVNGSATASWLDRPLTITAQAPGFTPASLDVVEFPLEQPLTLSLEPVVLEGRIVSSTGSPLEGAVVTMGAETFTTGEDGSFTVNRAVPGIVEVSRPAWSSATEEWDGEVPQLTVAIDPVMVRALRVSGPAAGDPAIWDGLLSMAEDSAVNAMVVDIKDERGSVFHDTSVPLAREIGAVKVFYDINRVVTDLEERGLYAITRIVVFQDSPLALARPEWAAWDVEANTQWTNYAGHRWLDPTDRASWDYSLDLAVEACEAGFDEIQFDYVRFPSDGPLGNLRIDGTYDEETRVATVAAFLSKAKSLLHPLGCAVAADIFAIVISVDNDQGIGQTPEELASAVDVISPMIYPSHYNCGWRGYQCPNDYPSEIVGGALEDGMPRLVGPAFFRPWLQAFGYEPDQILAEIAETDQRELGWMLWHAASVFDAAALPVG